MRRILIDFHFYGIRRVTEELPRRGQKVNHKRVERIMREAGLTQQKRKKRFRVSTTDSRHGYRVCPNLAAGFKPTAVNQLWVTDITYIRIQAGFVYLAAILDAYSRKVIGCALSKRLDMVFTMTALRAAVEHRRPAPGCIHHSDRGVHYAYKDYTDLLHDPGFEISMSRKGNCCDNAMAESFWRTLKVEEVYVREYRTWEEVIARLPEFIERV